MATATHRIRRLRWHVRLGPGAEPFEVRARLRQMNESELLPEIERAFDAAAVGGRTVRLQRLDLAIRVADLGHVGEALAARIQEQAAHWRAAPDVAGRVPDTIGLRPASAPDDVAGDAASLLRYLATGLLPWPSGGLGREETRAMLEDAARVHADRVAANMPRGLGEARAFVLRWLQLVPESEWIEVARRLDDLGPSEPVELAVSGLVLEHRPHLTRPPRHLITATVLAIAAARRSGRVDRWDLEAALGAVSPSGDVDALVETLPRLTASWIRTRLAEAGDAPPSSALPDASAPAPAGSATRLAAPVAGRPEMAEEPGLAVHHVGLVLLHPFLPRLFEQTAVIRPGRRTIAPDALPRAAALLSFAAKGADEPLDFELGFVKVLLGLQPDTELAVPPGLLGASDRREVDALLRSVVEHWPALKRTSVEGLRSAFLDRTGLLADTGGAWRLRVQPGSFDVLLDQLPWGIGTVTLPWMPTLLFTEWPTP